MVKFEMKITKEVDAKFLETDIGVRYWEDGVVNGDEDNDGNIPLRKGDAWCPTFDLDTGGILDWPNGTTASLHYKVCDAGIYRLLDADRNVLKEIEGYVPSMLAPSGNGYGDYVIMDIDADGKVFGWKADLGPFYED